MTTKPTKTIAHRVAINFVPNYYLYPAVSFLSNLVWIRLLAHISQLITISTSEIAHTYSKTLLFNQPIQNTNHEKFN